MNRISFVDELVKVGAIRCLYKRATDLDATIPEALMSSGPVPDSKRVVPDEASTRVDNAHLPSVLGTPGRLGDVTVAKKPIDQERFNRPWIERR